MHAPANWLRRTACLRILHNYAVHLLGELAFL